MRLRVLALLGGLVLLLPAAAFAQSAGDEQYTDPLASPRAESPSNSPSSSTPTQHAATPSPSNGVASDSQGSTASAGDTSSSGSALPHTGLRAWMLAAMGGLMLVAGAFLRFVARPLRVRVGSLSPPVLGRDIRLTRTRR